MSTTPESDSESPAKTPLYDLHLELGARMVAFAGYYMPVQYPDGIIHEHQHTRAAAGLFDVSHMGQVRISGDNAARGLESLAPMDAVDLDIGHMRYGVFTDAGGGILDDLIIATPASTFSWWSMRRARQVTWGECEQPWLTAAKSMSLATGPCWHSRDPRPVMSWPPWRRRLPRCRS